MILVWRYKLVVTLVVGLAILALSKGINAQKTVEYAGYRVSTTIPKNGDHSVVTVKKGGRTLAVHREGIAQDYGSTAKFISLIRGEKQLVISQYTGGAHCCSRYWIYELTPRFRLLFRSLDFDTLGYSETEEIFQNIDNDADLEIVDHTPAFHYFDDLAFVSSPVPTLLFNYDHRTRRFELANRRFASYLLKDQAASITRSQAMRKTNPSQHRVDSLGLFLNYVYAGKEQTGWRYYHQEKTLSDWRQYFHKDRIIKSALVLDPAYRKLYRK